MEQRITVDDDVAGQGALHLHAGPGREHLGAVTVARQLGRAGGAAGMKVGGQVGGQDISPADQPVGGLLAAQQVEVQHALGPGLAIRHGRFVVGCDTQHRAQRGYQLADAQCLGPDAGLVIRPPGDQDLGLAGVHEGHQFVVVQQGVEWLHNACRFPAPQREVIVQAARQQHGNGIARLHTQAVQQVGGLVDACEQFGVGPLQGGVVRVGAGQKAQRDFVSKGMGRVAQQLIGAVHRHRLLQWGALQLTHIGQGPNRARGRKGRLNGQHRAGKSLKVGWCVHSSRSGKICCRVGACRGGISHGVKRP